MADEPPPIDDISPSHAQEQDDAVSKEEGTIKEIPLDEDKPVVKEDPPAQGNDRALHKATTPHSGLLFL